MIYNLDALLSLVLLLFGAAMVFVVVVTVLSNLFYGGYDEVTKPDRQSKQTKTTNQPTSQHKD